MKLDDVPLQPGEIQFGEVTVPQRGRTALLIGGVTVGTAAVALLVGIGVAFSSLRF